MSAPRMDNNANDDLEEHLNKDKKTGGRNNVKDGGGRVTAVRRGKKNEPSLYGKGQSWKGRSRLCRSSSVVDLMT